MDGGKRVLVVDDEPLIRQLVADFLAEAGYQVDAAANGAEALRVMAHRQPHAVVLDLMMPRLDANGFVHLLRLSPRHSRVPVIVMTAAYGGAQEALRLGAKACLLKPFELEDLLHAVERLIGRPSESARPVS
jgi:CheY-like chemotaxis protein